MAEGAGAPPLTRARHREALVEARCARHASLRRAGGRAGRRGRAAGAALRFVIQRHDATRLHYDFRLELDGVFKSWAVTRGPSLDPHDKRLAVEVEDHPLDYGDFEGTIPKGQYGGGTVQLWDRGYWLPEGDPHEGLKKGDLKFVLEGERLHGSWVLVRMKHDRNGGKRTNWLLIKHRDEAAREGDGDALLKDPKSIASGRTLKEIALGTGRAPTPFMTGKKRTAGAVWDSKEKGGGEKSRPRQKDRVQGEEGPRRCRASSSRSSASWSSARPPEPGWAHEVKFDGYRLQLARRGWRRACAPARASTGPKNSSPSPRPRPRLPDCLIDGEVVALDQHGAPDFAALAGGAVGRQDRRADLLRLRPAVRRGRGSARLPLSERKERLKDLLDGLKGKHQALRYVEHFETGGDAVLRIGLPHASRRHRLEEARRALPVGPQRQTGPRPSAAPAMRW